MVVGGRSGCEKSPKYRLVEDPYTWNQPMEEGLEGEFSQWA